MPQAPAGPGQATVVAEWRGTLGSYATAARRLGCQAYLHTVDGGAAPGSACWPAGVLNFEDLSKVDV
eukprot:14008496-Alexandrium_andersonii.AAC.1